MLAFCKNRQLDKGRNGGLSELNIRENNNYGVTNFEQRRPQKQSYRGTIKKWGYFSPTKYTVRWNSRLAVRTSSQNMAGHKLPP